jgi:hypothetical protein
MCERMGKRATTIEIVVIGFIGGATGKHLTGMWYVTPFSALLAFGAWMLIGNVVQDCVRGIRDVINQSRSGHSNWDNDTPTGPLDPNGAGAGDGETEGRVRIPTPISSARSVRHRHDGRSGPGGS